MTMRRTTLFRLLALGLLYPLSACKSDSKAKGFFMKKEIVLNVVVFNYTDRPIFEVLLNKRLDGGAAAYDGGRAIAVGVAIPFGPQTLTWRLGGPRNMERNGETVTAKNPLNLTPDLIPADTRYLAVHVYADETAELTFAEYLPDPTSRGAKILLEAERNGK